MHSYTKNVRPSFQLDHFLILGNSGVARVRTARPVVKFGTPGHTFVIFIIHTVIDMHNAFKVTVTNLTQM